MCGTICTYSNSKRSKQKTKKKNICTCHLQQFHKQTYFSWKKSQKTTWDGAKTLEKIRFHINWWVKSRISDPSDSMRGPAPDDMHRQCLILHSHPGVLHPSAGHRQRPKRGHPGRLGDVQKWWTLRISRKLYATCFFFKKINWKEMSQQIWHHDLEFQVELYVQIYLVAEHILMVWISSPSPKIKTYCNYTNDHDLVVWLYLHDANVVSPWPVGLWANSHHFISRRTHQNLLLLMSICYLHKRLFQGWKIRRSWKISLKKSTD